MPSKVGLIYHLTCLCMYLTLRTLPWETFKTPKLKSSAAKEHFLSYLYFICPKLLSVTCTCNNCSKCCPSACTHALGCFLHSFMAASITFCCRLFQTSMRRCFSSSTLFIRHSCTLLHNTPDFIIQ